MAQTTAPSSDGSAGGDLAWIAGATAVNLAIAALVLTVAGTASEGTELALRTTARVSFVWFALAFVAAPLEKLRPSPASSWLRRHRRAFGVIFGLSMSMHVGFILRLFALHAPERPPMVTDTDFSIGIPGLVVVALMTATSFEALRRRLGAAAWDILHGFGIWVVWAIFFLCLVDSVSRKNTEHPVLAYHSFIVMLLASAALRIAAWRAVPPPSERPDLDRVG